MNQLYHRTRKKFGLVLTSVLFFSLACNDNGKQPPAEPSAQTLKPLDRGDFVLKFDMNDEMSPIIKSRLTLSGELISVIKQLNDQFNLPYDIKITFQNIGQPNAFYDPNTRSIFFGYEFVSLFDKVFMTEYSTDEAWEASKNTVIFFLLHELGHALIDIYKIPLNGNPEDVADNFSINLLAETNGINQAAIQGASFFQIFTKHEAEMKLEDLPVLDEHLLDAQRFYNIVCKLYGSDPVKYNFIVSGGYLDESKTSRCTSDYQSMKKAWERDLGPWLK
jgi:hypothetical protein